MTLWRLLGSGKAPGRGEVGEASSGTRGTKTNSPFSLVKKKIQTKSLKDCMEENAEYYGIMLQAEEESLAAKEEAAEKMAAEGEAAAEGDRPKEED